MNTCVVDLMACYHNLSNILPLALFLPAHFFLELLHVRPSPATIRRMRIFKAKFCKPNVIPVVQPTAS